MLILDDTICAISTPPGVGGIAVARVSGPEAIIICEKIWKAHKRLLDAPSHTCRVGAVTDSKGAELDQAVATVFRAPHSFTGQDTVEISVHGSQWVQQELITALIGAGARLAEPGEFTRRAFATGRIDLAQAEGIADVIASTSRAAQRIALSQMRGHFSERLKQLRETLLELASLLELELDFSEEDVSFASRSKLIELATDVRDTTGRLASGFATGEAIRNGIPVAIVGATNAGKSSLLNALTNDDRAIVSDIHGTTRDVVEDSITLGDYRLRLMDTAGIRPTDDPIESLGIERSQRALNAASVILLVIDSSEGIGKSPIEQVREAMANNTNTRLIVALNKTDIARSDT
ncbi:MAG: tRNA uridine-5-carboxymethylaminomethyl(34) synthesis GTPase MnmE, partial [Muribaculaceae bacterium]|nr:tRNA uridine-5-carboxymethylaminomethyl(34) synthesis GTPase MnmE [Muribaculaceae bacterium]